MTGSGIMRYNTEAEGTGFESRKPKKRTGAGCAASRSVQTAGAYQITSTEVA